jgi:hypothetical protein
VTVIFSTIHGSRLYGMSTPDSDEDIFMVTDSRSAKARHSVNQETGYDQCLVGLDTFLRRIFEGSHQSVEALFSPYKVWHSRPELKDYLESMRINGPEVYAKYERTIKRFCFGDFKRRRHAARLALNLADLRAYGKFNPVMSPTQIRYAGLAAERYKDEQLWEYLT